MDKLIPIHELDSGWKPSRDSDGDIQSTMKPGDLSRLLTMKFGNRLRFNLLSLAPEIDGNELLVHNYELFHVGLSEHGWNIADKAARDALMYAARRNSYHPVREYLEHVEEDSSIEEADLDKIATNYLQTQDTLYDSMMAATLIAAVSRVMDPGCKFDNCTVLKGIQGIRKSSAWQALAGPQWFSDTPQDNDKDLRMQIQTCWIYELAELESITGKKEVGSLKALLSSQVDHFRAPYGSAIGRYPRQSILVATVNPDCFLRDTTGSRRFWIIDLPHKCGEFIDTQKICDDRDQIWKAAMLAYRSGRKPILRSQEQHESDSRNSEFEEENIFLAPLTAWFASDPPAPWSFTTHEALSCSLSRDRANIKPQDLRMAADALRQMGCIQDENQSRRGGERVRLWRRPDSDDSDMSFLSESDFTPAGERGLGISSHVSDQIENIIYSWE